MISPSGCECKIFLLELSPLLLIIVRNSGGAAAMTAKGLNFLCVFLLNSLLFRPFYGMICSHRDLFCHLIFSHDIPTLLNSLISENEPPIPPPPLPIHNFQFYMKVFAVTVRIDFICLITSHDGPKV